MSNVTGNTRAVLIIEFLLVLGFSVGLRYRAFPDLFVNHRVLVVPDDPPYHLRRVNIILNSPGMLYNGDPFVAFPDHARVYWGFGFDGILAGVTAAVFGLHPTIDQVALATSVLIPLLAGLVMLLVFFAFRKLDGDLGWSMAAMALMGVFHHYFEYSFAGRVDHHVIEPVFVLLSFILADRRPLAAGIMAGMSSAFSVVAFLPAYALVGLLSLLWVYEDYSQGSLKSAILLLGVTIGSALALVMSPNPLTFVYYSPSLTYVLFSAVASASAYAFYRISRAGPEMGRFTACCRYVALSVVMLGLLVGIVPALRTSVVKSMQLSSGSTMDIAMESLPFFVPFKSGHMLSLAMIILLFLGAFYTFKRVSSIEHKTVIILGVVGWIAASAQRRWLVGFSPFVVMSAVLGLRFLSMTLPVKSNPWKGYAIPVFILLLLVFFYAWRDFKVKPLSFSGRLAYAVAGFLQSHTPDVNPDSPEYAVLAPWSMGHVIQTYGGRPTICDNFFGVPENDRAMRRCERLFLATDMEKLKRELSALRVRYVVIAPPDPRQIKAQMERLGKNALAFVGKNGKFTMDFAKTLIIRLGAMHGRGVTLRDGTKLSALPEFKLIHTFRVRDSKGKPRADAAIFEFHPVKN